MNSLHCHLIKDTPASSVLHWSCTRKQRFWLLTNVTEINVPEDMNQFFDAEYTTEVTLANFW